MRYALLSYHTSNLGDEIQSAAARQFLPSADILVDRDRPQDLPGGATGRFKIILNGWHTHNPENWPPSAALVPLLVSVHISNEVHAKNKSGRRPAEALLEGVNLEYLRNHAPVGARDLWTLELLRAKNVDAYFSGCLTLTLGSDRARPRHDYVCAVDLAEPVLNELRKRVRGRVVAVTHSDAMPAPFADRSRRAGRLLGIYARAKCVVTSRLHCALPCLALRTPVLFVVAARDTYRFSGLIDLIGNCTAEEFLENTNDFDPNDPPANSDAYLPFRRKLVETAGRFIEPTATDAGAPLHPFVPGADMDGDIAIEQSLAQMAVAASRPRRAFQRIFQANRDYSNFSRPDFLRDLARAHRAMGNLDEAKRLLQLARDENPSDTHIEKLLDDVLSECARR